MNIFIPDYSLQLVGIDQELTVFASTPCKAFLADSFLRAALRSFGEMKVSDSPS
jgi:hypothetical protein